MEDGSIGALAGLVVLAVILTWFAFGIGLIVRNSPATVSILLLWPLVAEGLIAVAVRRCSAPTGSSKWLPYQACLDGAGRRHPTPTRSAVRVRGCWFGWDLGALVVIGLAANLKRDA